MMLADWKIISLQKIGNLKCACDKGDIIPNTENSPIGGL